MGISRLFETNGNSDAKRRLEVLAVPGAETEFRLFPSEDSEVSINSGNLNMDTGGLFSNRFQEAGIYSFGLRNLYLIGFFGLFLSLFCFGFFLSSYLFSSPGIKVAFAFILAVYFGLAGFLFLLKRRAAVHEREVLLNLPLALEGIILLVESGLGILPAMNSLIKSSDKKNPVMAYFQRVYNLSSSGLQFREALRIVSSSVPNLPALRHVLLHLDISHTDGGEILPSLRGLSSYCQTEWKLSVQSRVKRLENLVVFPVFLAVIGLLFLTAAVPILPILDLQDELKGGRSVNKIINGEIDEGPSQGLRRVVEPSR